MTNISKFISIINEKLQSDQLQVDLLFYKLFPNEDKRNRYELIDLMTLVNF